MSIDREYIGTIDFGQGERQDTDDLLCVRWPGGTFLILKYTWAYHLTIERDHTFFYHQIFRREDGKLIKAVRCCARDISAGVYRNKKTVREKIGAFAEQNNLTSCMNNTKWSEFRTAMQEEMPFGPPYLYKTLFYDEFQEETIRQFEMEYGPYSIDSYDEESFNFLDYKTIEWVKARPRFFALEGGLLVKQKVWYDAEEEFVRILEKYNIPYEEGNGVYTIYGYKNP